MPEHDLRKRLIAQDHFARLVGRARDHIDEIDVVAHLRDHGARDGRVQHAGQRGRADGPAVPSGRRRHHRVEDAAPLAWAFRNTVDGFKVLFADGIYGEFAVFEPEELSARLTEDEEGTP